MCCLLNQHQCAHINEELYCQHRSSEIINLKLHKEFQDASSATKALETKFEVLIKQNKSINKFCLRIFLQCQLHVTDLWFVQKKKKLAENLEKIQCEHRNALVYLEKEKKLICDRLKAAQVRKKI